MKHVDGNEPVSAMGAALSRRPKLRPGIFRHEETLKLVVLLIRILFFMRI